MSVPDSLAQIAALAKSLTTHEARVAELEGQLADEKRAIQRITREDLPTIMQEAQVTSVGIDEGRVVTLTEACDAHISEANRDAAHAWLTENGFGGLIKVEVSVAFGRGERDAALACAEVLREAHEGVVMIEAVHPQTLKAFVREQLEAGTPIPTDIFGIFPYSVAKISAAKTPKKRAISYGKK